MINLFSTGNNNPAPKSEVTPVIINNENNITKIFVVEDNDLYSQLIMNELTINEQYEVTIYPTAEALLKDLYKNPNIVTIDYNLPDGNSLNEEVELSDINSLDEIDIEDDIKSEME